MTVLVKFQIEIRFSIESHWNSKLSMTPCPPSSGVLSSVVFDAPSFRQLWLLHGFIYLLYITYIVHFTVGFDLTSVRRQLMEEYKESRGKLPLLPGMPEEFAQMEDLFVDLEIIREDKKPSEVIPYKLRSCDNLLCIKRDKYAKTSAFELVKRVLVRGIPGAGKSSTVSKVACDWACEKQGSPVTNFQLLFAITVNKIDTNTDLIGIIKDQLLPKVSRQGLADYIQSNASSIAILADGYDEASEYFHQCRDIQDVLTSKWLAESCVIVTSRPNQVGKFHNKYGSYVHVEVQGFSEDNRERYVRKFMQVKQKGVDVNSTTSCNQPQGEFGSSVDSIPSTSNTILWASSATRPVAHQEVHTYFNPQTVTDQTSDESTSDFLRKLSESSRLHQLSSIPIILSMPCLLWVNDAIFPSTVTALYKEVILHLAKHKSAKETS